MILIFSKSNLDEYFKDPEIKKKNLTPSLGLVMELFSMLNVKIINLLNRVQCMKRSNEISAYKREHV